MNDWKTNYENNMAMATQATPGNTPTTVVSNDNTEVVVTDFGTYSVTQLNKLLGQLPKNPDLINDYLSKVEKDKKELKFIQKVLDIFSKI